MKIEDLLQMDMGAAIDWLVEHQHEYRLVKVTDIDCDNCGTVFETIKTVYDSDTFNCPDCGHRVQATVDEDGSLYWNTIDDDGEYI